MMHFVSADTGGDTLFGDAGNNTLDGGIGDDFILGENGDDFLEGCDGADELRGGIGSDTVQGGDGNDTIEGGDGDDVISGDGSGAVYSTGFINTDNLQDGSSTPLNGTSALQLVEVAGRTFLIASSRASSGNDGVSAYEIDLNLGSPTYGQVQNGEPSDLIDDNSTGFGDIWNMASLQLDDGRAIVFNADNQNDAIGSAIIDADGSLTKGPVTSSSSDLLNVTDITDTQSAGNSFIIAFSDETTDGGDGQLTVYQINTATGALTQKDTQTDVDGVGENFLSHNGPVTNGAVVEAFTIRCPRPTTILLVTFQEGRTSACCGFAHQ